MSEISPDARVVPCLQSGGVRVNCRHCATPVVKSHWANIKRHLPGRRDGCWDTYGVSPGTLGGTLWADAETSAPHRCDGLVKAYRARGLPIALLAHPDDRK